MPIITIQLAKGRTEEQKQSLASKITTLISQELDVEKDWITVLFHEYERENWATGGELHSIKFGKGFCRAGTNKRKSEE
jgi:4-oxalocrotonate tautomerase